MADAKSVESPDPAKKTSDIIDQTGDEATVQMDSEQNNCFWNDDEFGQGEQVSSNGKCYECSFGHWIEIS